MSIITKPAIEKGTPASITLDKSALAALPLVSGDAYFSDTANWDRVRIFFTATGKQREVLTFDATQVSPQANFNISARARDIFQVQKIVILDFDGGSLEVPRSALVTGDFDVDLSPPVGLTFIWNKGPTITDYGSQSGLQTSSNGSFTNGSITQAINGDFDITMTIEQITSGQDFMAGFALSAIDLSGGVNSLGNGHMIHASHTGTSLNAGEWGLGMEDNPSGSFAGVGNAIFKVRFIRVGSTITYELTNSSNVVFRTGNAKTNYSGPVHMIFQPFNLNVRLNSIV